MEKEMTTQEAFNIILSVFPTLRLTEQERSSLIKAYQVVQDELGLTPKEDAKKK